VSKGKDGRIENVKKPEYNQDDTLFMQLIQTLALSTTTYFAYEPLPEEIRAHHNKEAKNKGTAKVTMPKELKDINTAS